MLPPMNEFQDHHCGSSYSKKSTEHSVLFVYFHPGLSVAITASRNAAHWRFFPYTP